MKRTFLAGILFPFREKCLKGRVHLFWEDIPNVDSTRVDTLANFVARLRATSERVTEDWVRLIGRRKESDELMGLKCR